MEITYGTPIIPRIKFTNWIRQVMSLILLILPVHFQQDLPSMEMTCGWPIVSRIEFTSWIRQVMSLILLILPARFQQGLEFVGNYLWLADYSEGKIYKLDTSGNVLGSFDHPGIAPEGLAFDGNLLLISDSGHDKIYKTDLSGNVLASFNSPDSSIEGLAFDGNYLWVAGTAENKIYKMVFVKVEVGYSTNETFTVFNHGSDDLTIYTLTITGPNSSEFHLANDNCSGNRLNSSETCTFDCVFTAASTGDKSATLQIPTSATDVPLLEIPLTANVAATWNIKGCGRLQHGWGA